MRVAELQLSKSRQGGMPSAKPLPAPAAAAEDPLCTPSFSGVFSELAGRESREHSTFSRTGSSLHPEQEWMTLWHRWMCWEAANIKLRLRAVGYPTTRWLLSVIAKSAFGCSSHRRDVLLAAPMSIGCNSPQSACMR